MSGRMRFQVAAVLLALVVVMMAVPAVMASERLAGPSPAVAALSVTSAPVKATHAVVRLYGQPDPSSTAVSWIMPSTPLWVVGMSGDLTFFAVTSSEKSSDIDGWVAVGDMSYTPVVERANRIAKVYRQRDTGSAIVNMLMPGQQVRLLGISPDGKWAAVASLVAARTAGWVPTSDLGRDYAGAQTKSLTKTYVRPDEGSAMFDLLSPGLRVVLVGRTADGSWIGLMSVDGKRFLGWARPGDVQHNMNLAALTVMAVS